MQFTNCIIIIGAPATPPSNTASKNGRSCQTINASPIKENFNGGGAKWNEIPFVAIFWNSCRLELAGSVFFVM